MKYKKYLIEGKKYPNQYSAETVADIANFLNSKLSTSGADKEVIDGVAKMDKIKQQLWQFAFGDKSPWKAERGKNWQIKIKWDKYKAEQLGL